jgi:hypothetical protein
VIIQDFTKLRADSQAKNIAAWTPVVAETLQGFVKFDDKAVSSCLKLFLTIPLTSVPVRPISPGRISIGYRAIVSRHGSRNTAESSRILY